MDPASLSPVSLLTLNHQPFTPVLVRCRVNSQGLRFEVVLLWKRREASPTRVIRFKPFLLDIFYLSWERDYSADIIVYYNTSLKCQVQLGKQFFGWFVSGALRISVITRNCVWSHQNNEKCTIVDVMEANFCTRQNGFLFKPHDMREIYKATPSKTTRGRW